MNNYIIKDKIKYTLQSFNQCKYFFNKHLFCKQFLALLIRRFMVQVPVRPIVFFPNK